MATYGWGTANPVEEWLFEEGHRFDFYQAVRMLELIYPERVPVGETSEPSIEVVRFKSRVELGFPGSEVYEIKAPQNGEPAEMTVGFFGLAGALGPLPLAYTETLLQRVKMKDTAMRDFLDLFNHRLISLMHRVRKLHRVGLDFKSPEKSHLAPYLYSLMGLETKGLKGRMGVDDRSLLYYAGIFSQQPHSMSGLEAVLSDYYGVRVKGNQLAGGWLYLDPDQTTSIGLSGRNNLLGEEAVLGNRVWDQQGKFELAIGPLSFNRLLDFLPIGSAYKSLVALTRFYAGEELDFNFLLSVGPETIPGVRLGADGGARLGWTSWLKSSNDLDGTYRIRLSPAESTVVDA